MYHKFQASQIFTGTQLLEGAEYVLITQADGTIEGIVPKSAAGEGIQELVGILSPGFINAHCHLELSHMKGLIPPNTGLQEFVKQIVAQRNTAAAEKIQIAIAAAENEMYENGIVAVGDICNNLDTLAIKSKHRLAYYSFVEIYDLDPLRAPEKIKEGVAKQAIFEQHCIRAAVVPHAPYSCSNNLLHLLSAHFGAHTISMHNQETAAENEFFEKKKGPFLGMYERTQVSLDFFSATGLSSVQSVLPKIKSAGVFIFVHNSFSSAADIQAVQKTMPESYWCLCPNANQYIENALPPIELLRAEKANMVIGTDSYASNWQLNILAELQTIQKNYPAIALAELLQWATLNGARALQMDKHLGSFEKGKQPGVVLIEGLSNQSSITNLSSSRRIQ